MVDIHSHIVPFVDDGSENWDDSLKMIQDEVNQGVNVVVCTPHFSNVFKPSNAIIEENFEKLKSLSKQHGLSVELYLAREVHYFRDCAEKFKTNEIQTVNGGKFVLLEFDLNKETDIDEACYLVGLAGYNPIIAHVERYCYYRSIDSIERLKNNGVLIQVNAESVVKKTYPQEHRFVKKLLKNKLVDFVASDVHSNRDNYMAKAYQKVASKDKYYADQIFNDNALDVLGV